MSMIDVFTKGFTPRRKQSLGGDYGHPFYYTFPYGNSPFNGNTSPTGVISGKDPTLNSVVAAAVQYITNGLSEGVYRVRDVIKDDLVEDHELSTALNNPKSYTKTEMFNQIVSGFTGNGAALIDRSNLMDLKFFDWRNVAWPTASQKYYRIYDPWTREFVNHPMDSLAHLRFNRAPDGINGVGPLNGSVLGEIALDDEFQSYQYTYMVNKGVPGMIFMPEADSTGTVIEPEAEDVKRLEDTINKGFTGFLRGRAMSLKSLWRIFEPGNNIQKGMDLRKLRWVPEERILACLNLPPAVINIGPGSEASRVGATVESLHRAALLECLKPWANRIVENFQRELMPFYSDPDRYKLELDLSALVSMEKLQQELSTRKLQTAGNAYAAGLMGLVEARKYGRVEDAENPPEELVARSRQMINTGSSASQDEEMAEENTVNERISLE